ncbi:MAG: sigma 54-interacting transcriptional regulator [Myxococcota bacterium]
MSDVMDQTLSSLDGQRAESDAMLLLVGLGSPERNFAHAGAVVPLVEVRCVRFGRAKGETYESRRLDDALELSIPLPWVSSRHAELWLDQQKLRLVDHGSRNGTYVEGHAVGPERSVAPGQVLEVGRSFWTIRRVRRSMYHEPSDALPRMANPEVRQLHRTLARLAPSNVPILITGETGTGKEHLARTIHEQSGRHGPFVTINVAAGAIDRMLHGSQRLRDARGGTLYLDDVGELAPDEQTKLTSTLMSYVPNEWQLEPAEDAELRLISSSTRDLRAMVNACTFRPDLMARLAGFEARLPPLRARREDLGALALDVLREEHPGPPPQLTTEVFRSLLGHPWPFNLRELRHTLSAAARLAEGEPARIDPDVWGRAAWTVEGGEPTPTRIEAVRSELVQQLARHRGQLSAVAAALQCEIEDIRRWADRFSLQPERYHETG